MDIKIGDTVRFLDAVGGGRVTRISDKMIYVEDADGFETPALARDCVVIAHASANESRENVKEKHKEDYSVTAPSRKSDTAAPEIPVIETDGGDRMNVILGFEATNIKALSQSGFDAFLVNDSNYYLYAVLSTRTADSQTWETRFDGLIEPNMQVLVAELDTCDLPDMDRVNVALLPFKRGRKFEMKAPVGIELKLDTTKFAKLHCFRSNPYFDVPVIAFDIVRDDRPADRAPEADELRRRLSEAFTGNKDKIQPRKKQRNNIAAAPEIIEVDLHAAELLDSTSGLSNAEILNLQIDRFCEVMDANLRHPGQKIVFIHGKGEGVLRQALMKELTHRYKGHDVQDASFREYGFGATQVTIRKLDNAAKTSSKPESPKKRRR